MNKLEARELLRCHSFIHDDLDHLKMQNGFLGMLRPFQGELIEDNFHELMTIIEVLADELEKPSVERELIAALWGICQYTRAWALYPDSMLQRNNLLTIEQINTLDDWIDTISYAVMVLLEGGGPEEALSSYRHRVDP
ncbi:hypothetical protein [Paenibacillus polymyxa]|uniref:hypothetical protein n=1 Tax=Paenibacillus polymyxa TaxID=1406 RepID=UPI002378FD0C|nr:hypothetical protein [Paenibacillus polymyxa]WDM21734.1 hypothetical protein J4I02_22925 [Paenibacillus polymyxa]